MKALVANISCPDILNIDVDILMSRRVKIEDLYQQQRAPDAGLCCRSARVQLALFYMLMLDTEPFVATFSAVPCHFMVLLQPQQITNTGRSCVTEACWSAVSEPSLVTTKTLLYIKAEHCKCSSGGTLSIYTDHVWLVIFKFTWNKWMQNSDS